MGHVIRRHSAVTGLRDFVGHQIFEAGSTLHRVGLWLCGVAGRWDADTDNR